MVQKSLVRYNNPEKTFANAIINNYKSVFQGKGAFPRKRMPECFICMEGGGDPLGCACRGVHAHKACMVRFARESALDRGSTVWSVCAVCNQTFSGAVRRSLATGWIEHARDAVDLTLAKNNLMHTVIAIGSYQPAVHMQRDLLRDSVRIHGTDHPVTMLTAGNLALALSRNDELDAAVAIQRELLCARIRTDGSTHLSTLIVKGNLATTLMRQGILVESEKLEREVLADRTALLGAENSSTLVSACNLANVLGKQGRHSESAELLRTTHETQRRVLGATHADTRATHYALIQVRITMAQM